MHTGRYSGSAAAGCDCGRAAGSEDSASAGDEEVDDATWPSAAVRSTALGPEVLPANRSAKASGASSVGATVGRRLALRMAFPSSM